MRCLRVSNKTVIASEAKQSDTRCHPERSEGSQRFFALRAFCASTFREELDVLLRKCGLQPQNDSESGLLRRPAKGGTPRNDGRVFLSIFFILFLAAISLGAWWDFGKPKKEESQKEQSKKEQPSFIAQLQQQFSPKKDQPAKQPESESQGTTPEFKTEALEGDLPPSIEAANVQKELSEIIDRTSKLQDQVKGNRTEVLQIMERAKIHENILKTIKIPQPVVTPVKVVDADAIVQREKLRLIAEQTKQAQKQLEVIQRTRAVESQRT